MEKKKNPIPTKDEEQARAEKVRKDLSRALFGPKKGIVGDNGEETFVTGTVTPDKT